MATGTSSRRRIGTASVSVIYGGELLWCILSIVCIVSLLTHELSRHLVHASSEFEGFDFEEGDTEDELVHSFSSFPFPTTLTTTQSHTSEFHEVPPSPIPEPADPVPNPWPVEDDWDEDEFEGLPSHIHSEPMQEESSSPELSVHDPVSVDVEGEKVGKMQIFLRGYYFEIVCVCFLLSFGSNFFIGRKENENIAMAWAVKFATKDALFEKNFNLMGSGDSDESPLLLKEGCNRFKFYASGRKYCQGFLATLELKSRHDLISRLFTDFITPKMETITFEVTMNDDAMDQVVFALARKKLAKSMHKDENDLQRYAGLILNAPPGRKWVAEDLLVLSESKEVAGDMITDAVLDQIFGEKAFEKFGKWFVSMHFSDQHFGWSHKKVLIFKFELPDQNKMEDITRLMTLVPYYIDLVGHYKLSTQVRAKTEAARAKAGQEAQRELQNARQGEMLKRKLEKKRMIEESAAKLNVEAVWRKEEKDRLRRVKKATSKVKVVR